MTFLYNAHTRSAAVRIIAALVVLAALLGLAWWAYQPGLSGDFLFDDFGNLPVLGATGPVTHWATFWRYITSGNADPTGRPLTLLTFLIDARNWPTSPYPFKVTGIILHLINGALLAWVLWKLGCALTTRRDTSPRAARAPLRTEGGEFPTDSTSHSLKQGNKPPPSAGRGIEGDAHFALDRRAIATAALFGAGAWLLHPLFVSATLYIVQREAMLPATFELIGLLGWMASRDALARCHIKRALIGMALSAWICTGLAVLSKANGALFPILLLLTEWIVLQRQPMPTASTRARHRRCVIVFLIVPSVLVAGYLLSLFPWATLNSTVEVRGWSVGQRLLTEPRVLTDYLRLLFIPHAHSTGLFNDQFPISRGWLHPASTLPCVIFILALIGTGFALRRRHPAIALALLFYFTAQLMESGWIPLELYYEHRNYVPAMLLFWPIGLWVGRAGTLRFLRIDAGALALLILATLTFQRSTLWGDGFRQAQTWAAINPDSARAQANAALYDLSHNRPRLAAARLRLSLAKHPDDIQAPINLISAECKLGAVHASTWQAADRALAHTRVGGTAAFKWFDEALGMTNRSACQGMNFSTLQGALDAGRSNTFWKGQAGQQQNLYHLQGQLDLAEGKPDAALSAFKQALSVRPDAGTALQQAAYLGAHNYPQLGLDELDYYASLPPGPKPTFGMPRIHAWVLREQGWWPKETAYLRKNLEAAVADGAAAPTGDNTTPPTARGDRKG